MDASQLSISIILRILLKFTISNAHRLLGIKFYLSILIHSEYIYCTKLVLEKLASYVVGQEVLSHVFIHARKFSCVIIMGSIIKISMLHKNRGKAYLYMKLLRIWTLNLEKVYKICKLIYVMVTFYFVCTCKWVIVNISVELHAEYTRLVISYFLECD